MEIMFKKSQAAMEFLMTYGWAILVVLVAIGALAYFGVLSPDKFLPAKCQLPAGIACVDHRATTSNVVIVLQNGMGFDASGVTVKIGGACSAIATPVGDNRLNNGEKETYTAPCNLTSGSKLSTSIGVEYTNADTSLSHVTNGTITTRVE